MKKHLLFLSLFFVVMYATAQQAPPKKVRSVEGINEYELSNGLRVLIFPDPSMSTMTVNITYLVGSRHEGYGETGMAHLLEHMVFKGSTNHKNIPQELSSHGASPNGSTWYDRTNYFETFAANDSNLVWALSLESDRMINSFIAKKDLETEFSVVRNEFEMGENDPSSILSERVQSTAFLWHNYGKSTIGSKEDIEKVPIENLQAFYHKYYQPDNAVLTVAGKIDEEKTLGLINKYFGSIPRPTRKLQEPYTVEPVQDGERSVVLRRSGDVQETSCGYHIPAGSTPDFAALDVLNHALTNEPSGRLYKALVESKKASSVYGSVSMNKDPGFYYLGAEVLKEKSLDSATTTLLNYLDNLKSTPITQEEIDRAKTSLLRDYELALNNSNSVGIFISEFIAAGDWRLMFKYRDNLEKVTVEDVNRVAAAYLKPSNRTTGLFIPEKTSDRAEIPATPDVQAMLKDFKGRPAKAAAEQFDSSPANIEKRTKRGDIPGGAKYAILSKTTRGNVVKAKITLRIGSQKSLENRGDYADLTASMLMKGTKNLSMEQLNDSLAKLKAQVEVGGSGQQVVVQIETTRDNLKSTLAMVKEILHNPAFAQSEFDKLKEENATAIDQQKSDPQALAFQKLAQLTENYQPSDFRYTKSFEQMSEDLKKMNLDGVKKFYADFYNSANATCAVIGDCDEAVAIQGLTDILANWSSPEKYTRAADPVNKLSAKMEKILTPDKKNAVFGAQQNLTMQDNDPDYIVLIMGNYILGGGFLNSRLATRIRQKEGISYGVGSYVRASSYEQNGTFGSYAIYNPENSDKLIKAYNEELDRALKEGFTEAELKDAKSGFLQGRQKNRSGDDYLLNKLNDYLAIGRTMLFDDAQEKQVEQMTAAQVNAVFQKWIKPAEIVMVQAGDFK